MTAPSAIREVTLDDLSALLPGGRGGHTGIPPGVSFRESSRPFPGAPAGSTVTEHVIEVVPTTVLPQGDLWFMDPADVLARTADQALPFSGGAIEWLDQTIRAAATAAAKLFSFIPVVYEAGAVTMTTPTKPAKPAHARLTFTGQFTDRQGSPLEIWAWGLTFDHVDSLGGTTVDAAAKARALYQAQVAPLMGDVVLLTRTRVALLQDGRHVTQLDSGLYDQGDDNTHVKGALTTDENGQVGIRFPFQTALAVSFSGTRPGPTGKGRTFLPHQAVSLQNDFTFDADHTRHMAAAIKAVASGMSSGAGPNLGPHSVVSGGGKKHAPSVTHITTYRVGRIPDTMRSRRSALTEQYVTAP